MEFNEGQAIYLQIADYFCERILKKQWKQGEKIPSIREIAVQVEVNPNTAIRTYNFLQEKGIIYNKRGIGYFVSDNGYQKTLDFKKDKFIGEDLPQIFYTMDMLKLDVKDLEKYYALFREQLIR